MPHNRPPNVGYSQTYVHNVLNNVGIKRIATSTGAPHPPIWKPRSARTKRLIQKSMIRRIIHLDLKRLTRRKHHVLKPSHIENRKTTSRKLYEKYLSHRKFENMVILDEDWFYLTNCNRKRRICCSQKGETVPSIWVVEKHESYDSKFMVVGGMTGEGVLPLHRVLANVKINSTYYIDKVFKPRLEVQVTKLYGEEISKWWYITI
ncbi:hypothetical protein Fcan01_23021 [Folsomia candida]|uniref:Uncharacterized protein n=1 Tax=Folsomia candida TaxID=158441 RepID=A0A226DD59_FOLCA|nr:hypothetical protein Fcan01_23021 [Folsomia candida]